MAVMNRPELRRAFYDGKSRQLSSHFLLASLSRRLRVSVFLQELNERAIIKHQHR